jgi:hypothetical protein
MRHTRHIALVALLATAGCTTQPTAPVDAVAATAPVVVPEQRDAAGHLLLPVHTQVPLTLDKELTSQGHKVGDQFQLSVARDVMTGITVVIPKGTPATGEITYRTGKGTMGKSAKIEVEIKSLALNGRVLPLSGKQKRAGKGNGAASVATLILLGPLAAGITGTSARYKAGTSFTAYTVEPIVVPGAS